MKFFISSFTGCNINYVTHLIGIHDINKNCCAGYLSVYYYVVDIERKGEYCHGIYG